MKTILVISFTDLNSDPRVNRQIRFLREKFNVVAAGAADPGLPGVKFIRLGMTPKGLAGKLKGAFNLLSRRFGSYYRTRNLVIEGMRQLSGTRADLIIANDIETLPLALNLAGSAKVLFDAHEYAPREFEDRLIWKLFRQKYYDYLCKTYLKRADSMITVCEGIAGEYHRNYQVRPEVITNAAQYHELTPSQVDEETIKMVHHGGAISSRKIELMIKMMDLLDERFRLDLILVPTDGRYYERLKALNRNNKKIRFMPPLPMREIISTINSYDVGLYLLPPNSFNNRFALPNKFFEFIQARLALAVAPSPEMARIVKKYDCGIVSESFAPEDLARELNKLTKGKIEYYKNQSHRAARELTQETNCVKFSNIASALLQ
ncbi:MAG: capsular biosynthesis protein [Nitrospirae bacterium]|nr:capsular biosynthesis protein [Nitrospirota bacterium]